MRLIKKLVLSLGFTIIIPLTVMMIHIALFEYNSTQELQFNNITSLTVRINQSVSDYMDYATGTMLNHNISSILSETLHNPQSASIAKCNLESIISGNPYIYNSFLIDSNGKLILSTKPIGEFDLNETALARARETKKTAADFRFFSVGDKNIIPIYIPIITHDDTVDGFVVNFLDTKYITTMMQAMHIDDKSKIYIIDSNNNVLVSSGELLPLSKLSTISSHSLAALFQNTASWGSAESYRFSFDSYEGFSKEAVLQKNKNYDFCALYTFPSDCLITSTFMIICIFILYIVIIIGIIIGLYFKFKKDFQRPFDEIFKTIQIYEAGDWTYRPVIENSNELSMISDALWHMAEKMNYMYIDIKFNEYRYKLSLEFSNDIIYDVDLTKNSVDSAADKWESFFGNKIGVTEKQVFGSLANAVHPEDRQTYENYRSQLLHDCYDGIEKQCNVEFRILLNDGDYHWVLKKDILVKGATDNIEHIVGSIVTIDETKNIELKARVDSLTGLFNRAEFISRLDALFSSKNHTEGAVIFFDIDDFKHINDNYGHDVGDDVLKFVGKSIMDTIDKNGIGGRYGGDELLAYVYSKDNATEFANTILDKLSKDFIVRGSHDTLRIKSSIGIAYYPEHETIAENLIKKADAAMYHAKKNGKNQYRIYTPGDEQTG